MKRPDQVKIAPDQGMGDRLPPGQFLTTTFPVLPYGPEPNIDLATWEIPVFGLGEQDITLNWDQFSNLHWTTNLAAFPPAEHNTRSHTGSRKRLSCFQAIVLLSKKQNCQAPSSGQAFSKVSTSLGRR